MTTIYDPFPSITPTTSSLKPVTNTKTFISPLNGYVQSSSRQGSRWQLSQTFSNLRESERQIMKAYLARLNGQRHRAPIPDHSYTGSRASPSGTVTLNVTASAGDVTISTAGWPNDTEVLAIGDMIHVVNDNAYTELKMVVNTSNVSSNGSGVASITVFPEIHSTCTSGNSVVYSNPTGIFMLMSDPSWSNSPGQFGGSASPFSSFTINWIEDIT